MLIAFLNTPNDPLDFDSTLWFIFTPWTSECSHCQFYFFYPEVQKFNPKYQIFYSLSFYFRLQDYCSCTLD